MQPNACAVRKVKEDMASKGEKGDGGTQPRNRLPPEILRIIKSSLQVGALSGLSGVFVGSFAGVIYSSTPKLFALASGVQWFTLGTAYSASKELTLNAWGKERVTPREKVSASAIAGCIAGSVGGSLRSRRNVIPGAIMFGLFGAAGQVIYNMADERVARSAKSTPSVQQDSWLNSKWSPMKRLSDADYENMLREKLLSINAQIALVDEGLESVRKQAAAEKVSASKLPKSN